MAFIWTDEADALLSKVYRQHYKRGKVELDKVFEQLRQEMVVHLEKPSETMCDLSVPNDEFLGRLAILTNCPQPKAEVERIDWYKKIRSDDQQEMTLLDYMVQFWEKETQCLITEDLGVRYFPDWSKFYKNILIFFSLNGMEYSQSSIEEVIPWAHTCQARTNKIRKQTSPSPQARRSSTHQVKSSSTSPQSSPIGGSLTSRDSPSKKKQSRMRASSSGKMRKETTEVQIKAKSKNEAKSKSPSRSNQLSNTGFMSLLVDEQEDYYIGKRPQYSSSGKTRLSKGSLKNAENITRISPKKGSKNDSPISDSPKNSTPKKRRDPSVESLKNTPKKRLDAELFLKSSSISSPESKSLNSSDFDEAHSSAST